MAEKDKKELNWLQKLTGHTNSKSVVKGMSDEKSRQAAAEKYQNPEKSKPVYAGQDNTNPDTMTVDSGSLRDGYTPTKMKEVQ